MPVVASPARSGLLRRPAGAAMEDPRTLSVLLVTGFLGAGKTTLVNHLLRSRGELRVAVFVNEFGAVDIDGAFLRWQGKVDKNRVFSLKAGCICCGSKDDLRVVINEELSAMREELDLLIIETSGVTNPVPVLATLSDISDVHVERVVCVVDATTVTDEKFGSCLDAQRQMACADVVVLSKMDLLSNETADGKVLDRLIHEHCAEGIKTIKVDSKPQVPVVVHAENGVVEWSAICPIASLSQPVKKGAKRHRHNESADGFGRVAVSKEISDSHKTFATHNYWKQQPFNRQRFEAWAQSLPAAVVRAKGILRVAEMTRPVAWHFAGGQSSELREIECEEQPWGSELVLLGNYGKGWSPLDFDEGLDRCLA